MDDSAAGACFGGFHYTVDVAFASHDDLRAGVVSSQVIRVFVNLDRVDDIAAVLFACASAHRRAVGDVMPAGASLVDFPC